VVQSAAVAERPQNQARHGLPRAATLCLALGWALAPAVKARAPREMVVGEQTSAGWRQRVRNNAGSIRSE